MWIFLCAFNFDAGFIIHLVATFPIAFAFLVTLQNYIKNKSLHNLLFLCAWSCYLVWGVFNALVTLFLEPYIVLIAGIATIFLSFFVIIFLDIISRITIDPIKLSIVVALSAIKIMTMADPNAFTLVTLPNEQQLLYVSFAYSSIGIANLLFIGVCYVYYMVRIYNNAPINLRHASRQSVIGACIMGIFGPIVGLILPNIAPAVIGVGASLTAISFARQPQMAYILPFKTYRLMVIDMVSGLPLFSHEWVDAETGQLANFELFSAMLAGVNGVLQESLQKGGVRQIQLERSLLLLEPGKNVAFFSILITTKSSTSLCNALKCFTKRFEIGFGEQIPNIHDTGVFRGAENLIGECFPFVPNYI